MSSTRKSTKKKKKNSKLNSKKVYRSTYFDPSNRQHLEVYRSAMQTGFWPEDFFPDFVVCESGWLWQIQMNIVAHYLASQGLEIKNKIKP